MHYLVLNIVGILAVALIVGLLSERGDRGVHGLAAAWFLTVLSFWGWVIYAAVHFIAKFW